MPERDCGILRPRLSFAGVDVFDAASGPGGLAIAILLLLFLIIGWGWWWVARNGARMRNPGTPYEQLVYRHGALQWGIGMWVAMVAWSVWDHAIVAREPWRAVLFRLAFSAVVALSLTPMLCSKMLTPVESEGILHRLTEPVFQGMIRGYHWLLGHASGIPHLEAHMERSRGEQWRAYKRRTSAFFPLPPRH